MGVGVVAGTAVVVVWASGVFVTGNGVGVTAVSPESAKGSIGVVVGEGTAVWGTAVCPTDVELLSASQAVSVSKTSITLPSTAKKLRLPISSFDSAVLLLNSIP